MMPAAWRTPLQPNSAEVPVFGGMNGSSSRRDSHMPKPMNSTITATLIATTTALKRADWRMPT